jgi:hypothetical protein
MSPREAIASQARTSISSQKENFLSSSHISRISGREYLSITPRDYGTKAGSKAFFAECIPASRKGAYALDVAVIRKDPSSSAAKKCRSLSGNEAVFYKKNGLAREAAL